jgi:hypothetical protein
MNGETWVLVVVLSLVREQLLTVSSMGFIRATVRALVRVMSGSRTLTTGRRGIGLHTAPSMRASRPEETARRN